MTEERNHSALYRQYMRSPLWRLRRAFTIAYAGYCCEWCNVPHTNESPLEAHHKTYKRLGDERPDDLIALCRSCHRKADHERENEAIKRAADALWDARLDGWATKKWGERWEEQVDYEYAKEEFYAWLEKHGEIV